MEGLYGYAHTITKPKHKEISIAERTYLDGFTKSVSDDLPNLANGFPIEERYWDFVNQDGNFITA